MDVQPPVIGVPQIQEKQHLSYADNEGAGKSSADVSSGQHEAYLNDPKGDRALTARIDFKVIPILGLLYLICFLDRTNIANAKIAGMVKGLDMPSNGYNTALWIFYLPFVLAEIPLNMILVWFPKLKPNIFLGVQCFLLGKLPIFGMVEIFQNKG
jgi:hypothetical protein